VVRKTLALVLIAVVGFAAACGSGRNKSPAGTVPPPQPTTSGKTGTPAGTTNTARTTTAETTTGSGG
jgi:hypothetical protein